MTEEYWQRYKREVHDTDVWNSNELFRDTKKVLERKKSEKHPLELYNMCKSDNAYIRQIKNSPNITLDTVAELICRDVACDLQYCMSLQKRAASNLKKKIEIRGCRSEYSIFAKCLGEEKKRLYAKENELKSVFNLLQNVKKVDFEEKKNNVSERHKNDLLEETKQRLLDLSN